MATKIVKLIRVVQNGRQKFQIWIHVVNQIQCEQNELWSVLKANSLVLYKYKMAIQPVKLLENVHTNPQKWTPVSQGQVGSGQAEPSVCRPIQLEMIEALNKTSKRFFWKNVLLTFAHAISQYRQQRVGNTAQSPTITTFYKFEDN